jgi:tetratricopeptide (TPR) repeat protein
MAVEGGVFVSKEVHDQLTNQKEFEGISLGLQKMNGVGRLIEVYGLKGDMLTEPKPSEYQDNKIDKHSDDEVPSIAIIPFRNKGKEEDTFYAYGICADLISDVSSAGLIRVASKQQIEEAGKLHIDKLAKVLDVRYMANGELWRMGNMFQLSVELYDTKDKKVVWSDRWQEKWDNLPSIKGSLSDGLLKALDTKPIVAKKVDTTNTEAYEYYLKGKYKFEKKKNVEDINIARGLLQKAIELDDNLIVARVWYGRTYYSIGDYENAMTIYKESLKLAEGINDEHGISFSLIGIGNIHNIIGEYNTALDYYERSLNIKEKIGDKIGKAWAFQNIGNVHLYYKGDFDKGLDYYVRSLKISKELGNKRGMGTSLLGIGNVCDAKGDQDKALDYLERSLAIQEELGDKFGMGVSLNSIGDVHADKGDYDKALDYHNRSLAIVEGLGDKVGRGYTLNNIGIVYYYKGSYEKALEYLNKSLSIQKEIGIKAIELETTTSLYLTYKHLGKDYDVKEIHNLIKEAENIEFGLNLKLYQLLEDTSYLKSAYNQVQEKADNLESDVAAKFLSYPIPKAIVEEWEKVK